MADEKDLESVGELFDSLFNAAQLIAPMIVPGAGPIIAAGAAVLKAIDAGRKMTGAEFSPRLEAERDALEAKVRAHVHDTASRLRG